jgi:DNA-directed RNA polymerase specialized sigma24 family protein
MEELLWMRDFFKDRDCRGEAMHRLWFWHGFRLREVAEIFGVSVKQVTFSIARFQEQERECSR